MGKKTKNTEKTLSWASAVVNEDHAYFIGSVTECAAYIQGYNCHADMHGEVAEFTIETVTSVK